MNLSEFHGRYGESMRAFVRLSRRLGDRRDYVQGGGGNTSVKLDESLMAIKASGFCLSDLSCLSESEPSVAVSQSAAAADKAYAVLDYAALRTFYAKNDPTVLRDVEAEGAAAAKHAVRPIDGLDALRPSVEAGFHALLGRFVAHTHSVYANFAACSEQSAEILSDALKDVDYGWILLPYIDPGARLTFGVRDALAVSRSRDGREAGVVFMQNHGVIVASDDADQCWELHEEVNQRLANYFSVKPEAYPEPAVVPEKTGGFRSDTAWLRERLLRAGGDYDARFFTETILYPDQMVYLGDALTFSGAETTPSEGKALIAPDGSIRYNMPRKQALVIEETLTALLYVAETVRRNGGRLSVMGSAARHFIGGWESEKYRRSLSEHDRRGVSDK